MQKPPNLAMTMSLARAFEQKQQIRHVENNLEKEDKLLGQNYSLDN